MNAPLDHVRTIWSRAFAPVERVPAAEWVPEHFRLSERDSALPGRVVLEAWQREILEAYDAEGTLEVYVRASSQVGKTMLGIALALHAVENRPGPILYCTPSDDFARDFGRERIEPAIEANHARDLANGARSKTGRTMTRVAFSTGASLGIVGVVAPKNVSSRPVQTLICTEVGRYPRSTGKEGDPLTLAIARTKSYLSRRRVFAESSPGLAGSCRISKAFDEGDRRRWHAPCPECSTSAPIAWERPADAADDARWHVVSIDEATPDRSGIACGGCGVIWTPQQRLTALRSGRFVPTAKPARPGVVSFHFSEVESPRSDIADIVRRYLAAKANPEQLQGFVNTVLGEPFDPELATLSLPVDEIANRAEDYDATRRLPAGVLLIVAGVDTQHDRLEVQFLGFGRGEEAWSLDHVVIPGDPNRPDVWDNLGDVLLRPWRHPSGNDLAVEAACIDTGGTATQAAYEFSARSQLRNRPWFGINGTHGHGRPIVRKSSTVLRKGDPFRLLLVGTNPAKTLIFGRINNAKPGPGFIHFPKKYKPDFYEQLNSEKQRIRIADNGEAIHEYVKPDKSKPGEALDTLVYAFAARHLLNPNFEARAERLAAPRETEPDRRAALNAAAAKLASNLNPGSRR